MRLLDFYTLKSFLKNYVLFTGVLIALWVVMDMAFNFDELMEVRETTSFGSVFAIVGDIADFYFYQSFLIFSHLSGVIPNVAAAFTLLRLSRFNETTAMLAAGVPMLRIARPVILAAILFNALVIANQELVIPEMIPKLIRRHDELRDTSGKTFPIRAMQDDAGGLLTAARYFPVGASGAPTMEYVDLIRTDDLNRPLWHVSADAAVWDGSSREWRLAEGIFHEEFVPESRKGVTARPIATLATPISPEEIKLYRNSNFIDLLPVRKIDELLEHRKQYGATDLLRVKHFRRTQPLTNIILLLLTIPCVLQREPGQLKLAAGKSVVLSAACMGSIFMAQQLAGSNMLGLAWIDRWPAMMAWLPVFLFAPVAVLMLDRVKT